LKIKNALMLLKNLKLFIFLNCFDNIKNIFLKIKNIILIYF